MCTFYYKNNAVYINDLDQPYHDVVQSYSNNHHQHPTSQPIFDTSTPKNLSIDMRDNQTNTNPVITSVKPEKPWSSQQQHSHSSKSVPASLMRPVILEVFEKSPLPPPPPPQQFHHSKPVIRILDYSKGISRPPKRRLYTPPISEILSPPKQHRPRQSLPNIVRIEHPQTQDSIFERSIENFSLA
ncbi:unnamed protein product [Didymodactylos carnosus]|uniref:Uncharacterized protein n=1 Tax=Didymodactylos carnosus TaxID=1234261 RepID=A0A815GT07_9BILA|nr:unnamed protein product [Didymodactylos carnosus]CAF4208542.1 unnamed protein product [Didymodactylos carnosus]